MRKLEKERLALMLPLTISDTTDYTARGAVVEGYNDNVIELTPSPDQPGTRHPSPFIGAEVSITRRDVGARWDQAVSVGLRGQHYTPIGAPVGGDDGSALVDYRSRWDVSPRDVLSVGQSLLIADENIARLYDAPLAGLDPFIGRSTWAFATTDISWDRDIDEKNHLRLSTGGEFRDVLSQNDPASPPPGVDYASPRVIAGYRHELGERDALESTLELRYYYAPSALVDLAGTRASRSSLEALPREGWSHAFSENWDMMLLGGASIMNGVDGSSRVLIAPTADAELFYTLERTYAEFSVGVGFAPAAPGLAPGYTQSAGVRFGGRLSQSGFASRFTFVLDAAGARSDTPVSSDSDFIITTAAVGAEGHYALTRPLGIIFGYEGRVNRISQTNSPFPATNYMRNLVYAGLSLRLSTMPEEEPIEVGTPPTRP